MEINTKTHLVNIKNKYKKNLVQFCKCLQKK